MKIYLFWALLLSACIINQSRAAEVVRPRVSASSLTMEDRARRLGRYGDLFEAYHKSLVKKAIDLEEKEKLQEKERTLASIEKSLKTIHEAQYQILVATHQISIIALDNERLHVTQERCFGGTWRNVCMDQVEKNAITTQERDFISGYPSFDDRLLQACKKVKATWVAVRDNAAVRVEKEKSPPVKASSL